MAKATKPASVWNTFEFLAEHAEEVFTQVKLPSGVKTRLEGYAAVEDEKGLIELAKAQQSGKVDVSRPKSEQNNDGTATAKAKNVPVGKLIIAMKHEYGIESGEAKPKLAESTEPKAATA